MGAADNDELGKWKVATAALAALAAILMVGCLVLLIGLADQFFEGRPTPQQCLRGTYLVWP